MKIKNILIIAIIFSAIFLSFLLQNCENKKTEEIKIGLVSDLTGPMALYGGWVKNGAEIAIEEINNKQPEGLKAKLIIEDSKSDPKTAVNAIQKLITIDKVNVIIGGNGSSCIMAMAPVANRNNVILFVALASSPSITDAGDYVFRNRVSGLFEAKKMSKFAYDKGFTKIAAVALNNEAGIPYIDAFENELKLLGIELAARELFAPGATDLRTQVLNIKSKESEVVFVVLQAEQAANFMNQCLEVDFKPVWLGVSSLKSDKMIELAKEASENMIIANEGIDENNKEYISFNERYNSKFEENTGIYSINGYDATMILFNLIHKVGNEPVKIKESLYNLTDYIGAGGNIKFDINGDAIRDIQLLQLVDGEFILYNE